MSTRYLIFKSIRGLARPWLVFSPGERRAPCEHTWNEGYATWKEAINGALHAWTVAHAGELFAQLERAHTGY